MIDKIINLVKSNVTVLVIFYACGFLSFIAHYYVLGLLYISGNAQTYAELAGKNIITILQTYVSFIIHPDYLIKNLNTTNLSWTGNAFYLWVICVFLLLIIETWLKYFRQSSYIVSINQMPHIKIIQFTLIAVMLSCVFYIQSQPIYAQNVLQPNNFLDLVDLAKQKQNIFSYEKQINKVDYERRIKILNQFNKSYKEENMVKSFFFSTPDMNDKSGNNARRINAFMVIVLVSTITIVFLWIYRQHNITKWLIFCFTVSQVVFLPLNYGILGIEYEYPVISLTYTEKEKIEHKEGVFLLTKTQDSLVIYDRLNFFEISYIPQSSVIKLQQMFISSPFSNCDINGEFKPCEIYAVQQ